MESKTPDWIEDMNRLEAKRIIRGINKYERKHLKVLNYRFAETISDDKKRKQYIEAIEKEL